MNGPACDPERQVPIPADIGGPRCASAAAAVAGEDGGGDGGGPGLAGRDGPPGPTATALQPTPPLATPPPLPGPRRPGLGGVQGPKRRPRPPLAAHPRSATPPHAGLPGPRLRRSSEAQVGLPAVGVIVWGPAAALKRTPQGRYLIFGSAPMASCGLEPNIDGTGSRKLLVHSLMIPTGLHRTR